MYSSPYEKMRYCPCNITAARSSPPLPAPLLPAIGVGCYSSAGTTLVWEDGVRRVMRVAVVVVVMVLVLVLVVGSD